MSDKKVKKQIERVIYQAGLEYIQRNHYPVYANTENKQPDSGKKKSVLECKQEEAARNEIKMKGQELYETVYQQRKLEQYKKELEKERKARKKVIEQQQDLKYLVKNLQSQLKEIKKDYQKLNREQQKNYQKLKEYVKKKNKKQERKFNSIKNILGFIIYMAGIPYYGESLKEIEKRCKERRIYTKKNRGVYIDCDNYKEIH